MSELAPKDPIDLAHLARYTGGDRQLNSEVFLLFSDHCLQSLRSLQTSLDTSDGKGWRDTAHALKGAALGVGAFGVAEQAGAAEAMDPETDLSHAAIVLAALNARSGVVLAYIEAYLASE
jgi:HPt (histidine-containing phosphotransfer) domain-containing protein